jgi:hypothetical protein
MKDFMKKLGVVVEGIPTRKNKQISSKMTCEKQDEGKSSHSHY